MSRVTQDVSITTGLKTHEDQGSGNGAMHVITDASGANAPATAAAVTNVASNASSVTLLAANANRRGAVISNAADKNLRIKFGATASASSFTALIAPNTSFSFPTPMYTGIVDGIWEAGPTGNAAITELT